MELPVNHRWLAPAHPSVLAPVRLFQSQLLDRPHGQLRRMPIPFGWLEIQDGLGPASNRSHTGLQHSLWALAPLVHQP